MKLDDRAQVPPRPAGILTARTLADGHPTLLGLLEPGLSVLDVGCGPGTLTAEIARRVAPGHVVGMDASRDMIRAAEAAHAPGEIANLVFYAGDIRASTWDREFDVANAVRALQWIPDPERAVARMARAVVPGGRVVLRDYDHTAARWTGAPPAWTRFYAAYLAWRAASGLDNAIAGRLTALATAAGLCDVEIVAQRRSVQAGEPDFFRVAGLWRLVVDGRGRQVAAAGYLSEAERRAALDAYTRWMQEPGVTHRVSEASLVARRPGRA